MSDPITIPPEALEAAARALAKQRLDYDVWDTVLDRNMKHFYTQDARATCLAMLEAWPGMHKGHQCIGCGGDPQIILPLPAEVSDG